MKKQFIKTTKYGTSYYSDAAMTILHREDGPAVYNANCDKYWYLNDERHREDGPAYEGANGDKYWFLNDDRLTEEEFNTRMNDKQYIDKDEYGTYYFSDEAMTVLHRENGPAIEYTNGGKAWFVHGKCHREDGPAVEDTDDHKEWWINGKLHREDGPAIEYADGYKAWYLNDKHLTEEEFNTRMKKKTEYIKGMVTEVSIRSDIPNWNPIFNSIKVGPADESGGSFLKITADDERNDGACISLDWNEWDSIVAVVAKYREDWEWEA